MLYYTFLKRDPEREAQLKKTREKVPDVLALVQRLNSPLVFQPDCDKLWSVANSLSPCSASTLPFLWPAHLSGTLVSGPETAIYDSPQLIFYWPNYYNQKIRYELGLSEGENIHFKTTGSSRQWTISMHIWTRV